MWQNNLPFERYPLPGDPKLQFADLVTFSSGWRTRKLYGDSKLDERFGISREFKEIYDFQKGNPDISQPAKSQLNLYSDGTLTILNSNNIPKFKLIFENLFPISLTTLEFDATQTDLEYFTAEVTFKYTIYNIRDI